VAPEAFDLAELVAEIAAEERPAVEAKNLALEVSVPGPLAVTADRGRIGQVLENLIGNAVKFTSRGGLAVSAEVTAAGLARVTVRDTGIGIAPEDLPQIFERFIQLDGSSTRRYGGIGLGLAIVKSILDAHHAPIHVASQQGNGTEFSFDLTLAGKDDRAAV
jgi:signal transduction histidine kinase